MKPIAKLGLCTLLIVGTFNITGCSVFMAAKQPEKKDTKMLAVGVPRAVILAEFGAPVSTVKGLWSYRWMCAAILPFLLGLIGIQRA